MSESDFKKALTNQTIAIVSALILGIGSMMVYLKVNVEVIKNEQRNQKEYNLRQFDILEKSDNLLIEKHNSDMLAVQAVIEKVEERKIRRR